MNCKKGSMAFPHLNPSSDATVNSLVLAGVGIDTGDVLTVNGPALTTGNAALFGGMIEINGNVNLFGTGAVANRVKIFNDTNGGAEFLGGGDGELDITQISTTGASEKPWIICQRDAGVLILFNNATKAQSIVTGLEIFGSLKLDAFTVAGVPSAATHGASAMVYISNDVGGAVPAFSDGTNWRRVTDRAIITT